MNFGGAAVCIGSAIGLAGFFAVATAPVGAGAYAAGMVAIGIGVITVGAGLIFSVEG